MFAVWPFIDSFAGYLAMAVVMEVIGALGGVAHGAYTIDVLPPRERVTSRAYMYSALNVGFTLGSFVGIIALALESLTLLGMVPWFTAAVFMVNAVNVTRLPKAPHDLKTVDERKVRIEGPGPMRNVGWLAVSFFTGVLWTNQVILNLVIPLWLVDKTDAPWVVLGLPLRDQHGDVHRAAAGGRPGRQGHPHGAAGHPHLDRLLRRLVRDHAVDPRVDRAGPPSRCSSSATSP